MEDEQKPVLATAIKEAVSTAKAARKREKEARLKQARFPKSDFGSLFWFCLLGNTISLLKEARFQDLALCFSLFGRTRFVSPGALERIS